ncbi:MAG: alpha/beta fold hydrolase [Pseudomonadota bacterium]
MRNVVILMFVWLAIAPNRSDAWTFETQKVLVSIANPPGQVPAFFALPPGSPPHPAIVMLHGCSGIGWSGSLSVHYSSWMRHLTKHGFAVLAVDSASPRFNGTTCGNRDRRRIALRERPADAYAALSLLHKRQDIDPKRIGLLGWSQGGAVVLLTIANPSIARPSPPPANEFAAAIAFYPSACSDRLQSEPFTKVKRNQWAPIAPLLVLHGEKDNWTKPGPCKTFIDRARSRGEPVNIHIYKDAVHAFDAPNLPLQSRSGIRLLSGAAPLIGTNYPARKDSLIKVPAFFKRVMAVQGR